MEATLKNNGKARFDTRLSVEQKELFERAAELSGFKSLSEFVVSTVYQKAKQIMKENEITIASQRDGELFFHSLVHPKEPNEALKRAAKVYQKNQK